MEEHHPEISEGRLFYFEQEEVIIEGIHDADLILDIGGGGEGIIGKLKGRQTIAIDLNKQELEEAALGPLKIVMDAADLQFLDESFNTVTSFYTLMYIKDRDNLRQVFTEVYRVLKEGGRFLIWDGILPQRETMDKDVAVFMLAVKLGEDVVNTGYGTLWPEEGRRPTYYVEMARNAGFEVVLQKEEGRRLFLELRKHSEVAG